MNNKYIILLTLLSLITVMAACTTDESVTCDSSNGVEINATIGDSHEGTLNAISSRASTSTDGSYSLFQNGDVIGFFSSNGLVCTNSRIEMSNGIFYNSELKWKDGAATNIFSYFPYDGTYDSNQQTINIWKSDNSGFEDILMSTISNVENGLSINLPFVHKFAMLAVKRGEGFDRTDNDPITVTLNKKTAKRAKVSTSGLTFSQADDGVEVLTVPRNSDGYYYVLIPAGKYSDGTTADTESITLKTTTGLSKTVEFNSATRTLDYKSGWKYCVTIILREDKVVIDKEEIVRWNDKNIIIEKPAGINSWSEFKTWFGAYNKYINEGPLQENLDALAPFGTYNGSNWTFCLNEDFSVDETNIGSESIITKFAVGDLFNGQGHTITGVSLSGGNDDNKGFFGQLNGTVENLYLNKFTMTSGKNAGVIAAECTSTGKVINCHVAGLSNASGIEKVGALVGNHLGEIESSTFAGVVSRNASITGSALIGGGTGTVTNSYFSGSIIPN